MSAPTLLIADDDAAIVTVLTRAARKRGWQVETAQDGESMMEMLASVSPDVLVTDVMMPLCGSKEAVFGLMPVIRERFSSMPVIVMTAQSTLTTAVKASEFGAFDYFAKPFDLDALMGAIGKALDSKAPVEETPPSEVREAGHSAILGTSAAMQQIYWTLGRMVGVDLTVMITGESGTGKELVAKALHDLGARSHRPFVAINMAAIPKELVESELFGHEKGAFTGALARKVGKFEQADGGTIFLDEIGDMPHEAQSKLLRVLQQGEFTSIGGTRTIRANVRIICATHRDLQALVQEGQFREDLYYRLNVMPIRLPPLRERKEDIPVLVRHFLRKAQAKGLPEKVMSEEGFAVMSAHAWPGNVRELENMIYRLCVLSAEQTIGAEAVQQQLGSMEGGAAEKTTQAMSLESSVEQHLRDYFAAHGAELPPPGLYERILALVERPLFNQALIACGGNQLKAAWLLGINRNTLRKRLQELHIAWPSRGKKG